jgi:hypothetical protein
MSERDAFVTESGRKTRKPTLLAAHEKTTANLGRLVEYRTPPVTGYLGKEN